MEYDLRARKEFLRENLHHIFNIRETKTFIERTWARWFKRMYPVECVDANPHHNCCEHQRRNTASTWNSCYMGAKGVAVKKHKLCRKHQLRIAIYHAPNAMGNCWCGSKQPLRTCHREHICVHTYDYTRDSWQPICNDPAHIHHKTVVAADEDMFICQENGKLHWCGAKCEYPPVENQDMLMCPWSGHPLRANIDSGVIPLPVALQLNPQSTLKLNARQKRKRAFNISMAINEDVWKLRPRLPFTDIARPEESTVVSGPLRYQTVGLTPCMIHITQPPPVQSADTAKIKPIVFEAGTLYQLGQALLWELLFSERACKRTEKRLVETDAFIQRMLSAELRNSTGNLDIEGLMDVIRQYCSRSGFYNGRVTVTTMNFKQLELFMDTICTSIEAFGTKYTDACTVSMDSILKQEWVMALLSMCQPTLTLNIDGLQRRIMPEHDAIPFFKTLSTILPPTNELTHYLTNFKFRVYTTNKQKIIQTVTHLCNTGVL